MTTAPHATADPVPPILAIGPIGTVFLSADPSVRDALSHLTDHADDRTSHDDEEDRPPVPANLLLFDRRGRELRVDSGPTRTLVVADPTDRRGEVCARIEEQFAHVRALAHRRPDLLDPGIEPALLRPPEPPVTPLAGSTLPQPPDQDYDEFFEILGNRMSHAEPMDPTEHPGSWWHNLFHRFG
jgi:hypothetical protein